MAVISIDIPNPIATEVMRLFATANGYSPQISDGNGGLTANPETRAQFSKRMIVEWIRRTSMQQRKNETVNAAAKTAEDSVAVWVELDGIA